MRKPTKHWDYLASAAGHRSSSADMTPVTWPLRPSMTLVTCTPRDTC